ncbi:hypothetical protein PCCS19_11230 [Paenibacillus sp. CCS19]|uniref:hypothetical protein n=1 Tax=Paenibacillus sp. CCS19 TaxID=3158387 RepID=UPI00255E0209|nr:hypothetical protein [Paenibacillus cellulosilyticus]GMK38069.1 hypothetical protein PCCS19_11230 [Paenibacillus cellulosilyticus]
MFTAVFLSLTCAMFAFIFLIDFIGLGKKDFAVLNISNTYFQIGIYGIGLAYCIWKDWRTRTNRVHTRAEAGE